MVKPGSNDCVALQEQIEQARQARSLALGFLITDRVAVLWQALHQGIRTLATRYRTLDSKR